MRRVLAFLLIAVGVLALSGAAFAAPPPDGSVGNADDRNPPGQSPGDPNRGYECDDQTGVGDGNPAHTGCQPTTTVAPTTSTPTSPTTSAADVTTTTTASPTTTAAETTTSSAPAVLGEHLVVTPAPSPTHVDRAPLALASTGLPTTPLVATALAMIVLGAGLLRRVDHT
jgi:hypothetical protein